MSNVHHCAMVLSAVEIPLARSLALLIIIATAYGIRNLQLLSKTQA
jgi:hypothetical protein